MSFANGLRAILRQDPDVILVGEIRDAETAQIAVQSALTGHLVLASLHAADAVGALYRFLDMGLEGYLVASAVIGVVAQRLMRINCDQCSRSNGIRPEEAEFYDSVRGVRPQGEAARRRRLPQVQRHRVLRTPRGLRVRVGRRARSASSSSGRRRRPSCASYIRSTGTRSLQDAACDLVDEGQTTLAEAMRTVYVL